MRLFALTRRTAVTKDLVRLYDEALDEPLPEELSALIRLLEARAVDQR